MTITELKKEIVYLLNTAENTDSMEWRTAKLMKANQLKLELELREGA